MEEYRPEILFVKNDEDSEVKIEKWKFLSTKKNFIQTFKKCHPSITKSSLSGWTKFESLVLISLIFVNLFVIGVLFPIVSTSIATLDKLIDTQSVLSQSLNENLEKQNDFERKVDKITDTGKQQEEQLGEIDGMNIFVYYVILKFNFRKYVIPF